MKRVVISLLASGLLLGGSAVPAIPTELQCTSAGDQVQFSTTDGYLHTGEWAPAEKGFKWVYDTSFKKQPDTYDTSKLQQQSVVGTRYWRLCNKGTTQVLDTQLTQSEYEGLKSAPGIKRQELDSVFETVISPSIASAAIANDATTSARTSSGTSITTAFTCTNNNTYMVVTTDAQDGNHANYPVTGITYNAVALTNIRVDEAVGNVRTEAWGFKPTTNCDGSAHNVVTSYTGALGEFQHYIATYTGVNQTTPNDANNGTTGNSSSASIAITTVADNAWIISQGGSEANFTGNGTGQTTNSTLVDQSFENGRQSYEGPKTPAGSDTQSFTLGFGAPWAITSVSLAPVATAATPSPRSSFIIPSGAKTSFIIPSGAKVNFNLQ